MLDQKMRERARDLINADRPERRAALSQEFGRITVDAARRGVLASSMTVHQFEQAAENELKTRSMLIWGNLRRVHSALGAPLTPTLAADFKHEAELLIRDEITELQGMLSESFPKGLAGIGMPSGSLAGSLSKVVNKANAEINLYVDALEAMERTRAPSNAQNVFHISGNIGAVQTAPGAVANVTQHLSGEDKESLLRALVQVADQIGRAHDANAETRREVEELVTETTNELNKPSPSVTKVKGSLLGVATTIQTLGSMQQAYQAVKAGLVPLGIVLP